MYYINLAVGLTVWFLDFFFTSINMSNFIFECNFCNLEFKHCVAKGKLNYINKYPKTYQ